MSFKKLKLSLFVIFIFSLLPLAIYGRYSWFYAGEVFSYLMLGALIGLSVLVAPFIANKVRKPNFEKIVIRRKILVSAVVVFFPCIFWSTFGLGLPALISKSLAPNETMHTRVIEIINRAGRKGCDHELILEGFSAFLKKGLCVDQLLISSFQVGDPVRLEVNKSPLGIRVYRISKQQHSLTL